MPFEKKTIARVLDNCVKAINEGLPLGKEFEDDAAKILLSTCKQRRINTDSYLEVMREFTPGTVLKDFAKLGLAQKRHLGFLRKYRYLIELENGLAVLSHVYAEECSKLRQILRGKTVQERVLFFSGRIGLSRQIFELEKLDRQYYALTGKRNKSIEKWFYQRVKKADGERGSLYSDMQEGKNLFPWQKRKYAEWSKRIDEVNKQINAFGIKFKTAILSQLQLEFVKRRKYLSEVRAAQIDPALGRRQKYFFERAEKAMLAKKSFVRK
ncbi:MAG: hypothetical protein NTY48_01610 [Candidatus Diapherotrites archaeon]|nr:hypothetical protein [Candidatus Diapherotrites archaeon]